MSATTDSAALVTASSGPDEAVAVVRTGEDGPTLLAMSEAMRRACAGYDLAGLVAGTKGPVPLAGLGTLLCQDLGADLALWRLVPELPAAGDPLAELIRVSQSGGVALMYFGADERLRSWNQALQNFFPDITHFPLPGGTFEQQLDAIIANDVMPDIEGRAAQWRENLLKGFRNPMRPFVDRTPGGAWAIAVTCRLGDGSSIHIIADVSVFKEREEQLKSFMANAEGLLFSRQREGSRDMSIWGKPAGTLSRPGSRVGKDFDAEAWHRLIDAADRATYVETMRAHRNDHRPYALEFRWSHPVTGRRIWSREQGWVTTDRSGDRYFDSLLTDITDRKRAELDRRESEIRFRDFAELASDWFFETDPELNVTFLSDRYADFDRGGPDPMIGRNLIDVAETHLGRLSAADGRGWSLFMTHLRARTSARDLLLNFAGRSGIVSFNVAMLARCDDSGTFLGFRGVCRDVTDLIRARATTLAALERAEQANAARSAFIANMSHELRTPLNAIIGFGNIMASELMGPIQNARYLSYARDIADSGAHLLSLVNDLLDLSRIDADRYSLSPEPLDVGEEIRRAVAVAAPDAPARRIDIQVQAGMPVLMADRRAFRQMLLNLVGNAVKFTRDSDRIEVAASIDPGGGTCVDVRDHGRGIRPEDIQRVLEPFGRGHEAEAIPGTGLGLPLTARLAELHGGRMTLRSWPGEGTLVRLHFPPQAAPALSDRRPGDATGPGAAEGSGTG